MSGIDQARLAQQIKAVDDSPSDRLDDLVRVTGLDKAEDLRFGNWRGFDLTGADLRGFDFTGADLTGARFRNAHIVGATFDRCVFDMRSLREAADFDAFVKREMRRPAKSRRLLSDRRLKDLEIFRDTPLCPELVVIPILRGTFLMGSAVDEARLKEDDRTWDDEIVKDKGKRAMRIARRFALGRYPVTFEDYDAFLDATKAQRKRGEDEAEDYNWGRGRRPAINVSWDDAQAYCDWLNGMTGLRGGSGYRLPSEAEWEYACRAGTQTRRWWGDEWDPAKANGARSFEDGRTSPVEHYPANPWGLHDMIGNVLEWCADLYAENIAELPPDGAPYMGTPQSKESSRVLRGGSWLYIPHNLRSAYRFRYLPGDRFSRVGFRVARSLNLQPLYPFTS